MDIKPCPFCGATRQQLRYDIEEIGEIRTINIRCDSCGAWGPEGDTEDEAMENWNRRPETVLIPEGVDPNVFREAIKKMVDEPMKFITEDQ